MLLCSLIVVNSNKYYFTCKITQGTNIAFIMYLFNCGVFRFIIL